MADVIDIDEHRSDDGEQESATRKQLTKRVIDAVEYDPDGSSWQVVWDARVQNLGVRVRARSKNWILRYRNRSGKRRCWTIGPTSEIPVKRARHLAEQANARIALGEDPSAEKQEAKNRPDNLTLAELFERFIEDYARVKRKTWETDRRRLLPTDEHGDPKLGAPIRRLHHLRLQELERHDLELHIETVHRQLSVGTPVEANRVVQTIGRVINWGAKYRLVPREFHNILRWIDLNDEEPRKEYIRTAELSKWAYALFLENLKWRSAFWLTLLTGARMKSETLRLRWEDVHLSVGEFTFRETKNGTDHTLPMTPATRAIFDALPREGEWVFPSRVHGQHVKDPRTIFRRVRAHCDFVDRITAHALRDTAATYMRSKLHLPDGLNRAVLNHSSTGITDRYAHASIDDVKMALEKLETFVLEESGIADFPAYLLSGRRTRPGLRAEELSRLVRHSK